jgi:hypothetical protein
MDQSTASTCLSWCTACVKLKCLNTERENFYRWIETCPLTNYRISDADKKYVTYTFQFNSDEPDMDQLYDQVLSDLQK